MVIDDIRKTGSTESQITKLLVGEGGIDPANISNHYYAKAGFALLPSILKEPGLRGVRLKRGNIVPFRTPFSRRVRTELRMLAREIPVRK
jgi:hypothetical protein